MDNSEILMFLFLVCLIKDICCKQVAIKIVDEPTNYGMNMGEYHMPEEQNKLEMRISPSNFSGPPHLKILSGHCFEEVIDSYKYDLCPFANITQHEQSLRWNPYSGVLGVWQEWEIENNTFVSMVMGEGDSCGSLHRKTRVLLRCGQKHTISKVSEPSTCNYELVLNTPLVCHPDSLLVYPTLPEKLQREWDQVEGQLQAEVITHQGYKKLLHTVFEKAGYILPEAKKKQIAEVAKVKEVQATKPKEESFTSLYQCQSEYKKLREEVDGLRTLLAVNGIHEEQPVGELPNHEAEDLNPPLNYEHENHYGDYQWMHD